jgi:DNA-binding MarR family transcriptional regulator
VSGSPITSPYVAAHQAYAATGNHHNLWAFDIRILVALHERNGYAEARDLQSDLLCLEPAVRRSLRMLVQRRLITSTPRPGINATLWLTTEGTAVVDTFLDERRRYLLGPARAAL